jgi:hypothetical protein
VGATLYSVVLGYRAKGRNDAGSRYSCARERARSSMSSEEMVSGRSVGFEVLLRSGDGEVVDELGGDVG